MYQNIGSGNALGLGNVGGFNTGGGTNMLYWSSTAGGADGAYCAAFGDGPGFYFRSRNNVYSVRAVRAF
jgi:hypothetical protein